MPLYFYYRDRALGLLHVRLAMWLPFGLHVCLQGREYLARRRNKAGIGDEQRDNGFTRIDDWPRAPRRRQDLEGRQGERFLNRRAARVNPRLGSRGPLGVRSYYGRLRESV